jgi:hypothetical protein
MTRNDIREILGPVDDDIVAEIVRTGAERPELVEALSWIASDRLSPGRVFAPAGRTGALIDLLAPADGDDDDPVAAGHGRPVMDRLPEYP